MFTNETDKTHDMQPRPPDVCISPGSADDTKNVIKKYDNGYRPPVTQALIFNSAVRATASHGGDPIQERRLRYAK